MKHLKACLICVTALLLFGFAVSYGEAAKDRKAARADRAKAVRARKVTKKDVQKMTPEERKKWQEEVQKKRMARLRKELNVKTDEEWEIIKARIESLGKLKAEIRRLSSSGRALVYIAGAKNKGQKVKQYYVDWEKNLIADVPDGAEVLVAAKALAEIMVQENALDEEIREKLSEYRRLKKELGAKLEKEQKELKELLDSKQEAYLVIYGMLD